MERVGVGEINTNVDTAGFIENAFKNAGNNVGDVDTEISLMHDQDGTGDVSAVEPSELSKISTNKNDSAPGLEGKKKRKPRQKMKVAKSKKPPDAPKRFKSSFIFFSMAKRKEIRERARKEGGDSEIPNLTERVAAAWRSLGPLEREKYDEMARQDKERYNAEKSKYIPPPGVSLNPKRKRDPDEPKRPMSAYLSYANNIRGMVKAANPDCTNAQISKILSNMWKEMSDEGRKEYKDKEERLWEIYREKMAVWRENNNGPKKGRKKGNKPQRQKSMPGALKMDNSHRIGSIDLSSHVAKDAGVDDQLIGLGSVLGIDTNPNTDEIMATSALLGVRGGSQQHLGVGSADSSQNKGYKGGFGANSINGVHPMVGGAAAVGQAGLGQMEMLGPFNQHSYPMGGNNHAMAQLRGNPHQQYPGIMPITQQNNLSQLASLAGAQNDVTQAYHQLQKPIDQLDQSAGDTGLSMETGNGNWGNPVLNNKSGREI